MFNERKAVEAAAFFLTKKPGQSMPYYDLVKLLYLADRRMVKERGRLITGDLLWSLPWGPVLGSVLDSVRHGSGEVWPDHISTDRSKKSCTLIVSAPPSELSRSELAVLQSVWDEFGQLDSLQLMRLTHDLPEYTDTEGRVMISLEDIARAVGLSEAEISNLIEIDRDRQAVQRFKESLNLASADV